ncbi:MAG: DUF3786 domain-containing protein [Syntrophobacteria bacterium]
MPRVDDYREAFRLASVELAQVNPHRICSLSGAACVQDAKGDPAISIHFLNQDHLVQLRPEVEVLRQDSSEPTPLLEKILILHYLLTARGESLTKNLITFRQVPGGSFYYSAFLKRARDPLVRSFGSEPQRLALCGFQLGAKPDEMGDVSITLKALPRVPVTVVLWCGDDEFSPEGSLLFDDSIVSYLSTEDIAVLSGMVVYRLIRINQSLG